MGSNSVTDGTVVRHMQQYYARQRPNKAVTVRCQCSTISRTSSYMKDECPLGTVVSQLSTYYITLLI